MTMILDTFRNVIDTERKKIATRAGICLVFFLLGLCMTTQVPNLMSFLNFLM